MMTAAAAALAGALGISGSLAYLTDNEAAVNTFTVGKVQIDLTEPNYPGNGEEGTEHLVPNQEVSKDPKVTNTGNNDAVVFVTVSCPVMDVTLVADNGTKGRKEPTELFWFKDAEDTQGTHANSFHTDTWMELTEKEDFGTADHSTTTYVFAYRTAVAKDEETETLFDKIQLKNILENEVTAKEAQNIQIKAYAIQAAEILENEIDLTDGLTETNLNKIYDIFLNQQGSGFTAKDAGTNNHLDLKGNTL